MILGVNLHREPVLKEGIRCKMDLGYVWYDNELECFGAEKRI